MSLGNPDVKFCVLGFEFWVSGWSRATRATCASLLRIGIWECNNHVPIFARDRVAAGVMFKSISLPPVILYKDQDTVLSNFAQRGSEESLSVLERPVPASETSFSCRIGTGDSLHPHPDIPSIGSGSLHS